MRAEPTDRGAPGRLRTEGSQGSPCLAAMFELRVGTNVETSGGKRLSTCMLSVSGSGQRMGGKPQHSAYGRWEGSDGGNEGKPSPHASGGSFIYFHLFACLCICSASITATQWVN